MRVLLGAVAIFLAAPVCAFELCAQGPNCRAVSDAELDALRGGFEVRTHLGTLRIGIGITRGVEVNGHVVALSSEATPLVVQIGQHNSALPASAFHPGAMPTIVQNTLDNQTLKTFTILSASVNSLSLLKDVRLGEMMSRATRASGR